MKKSASIWTAVGFALFIRSAVADIPIPFEVRWASTQGPATPIYQTITSRDEWVQFWRKLRVDQERFMHGPTPRTDEAPEVDFQRFMLIVAGAGTKPSSGYGIAIESIAEHGAEIRVLLIETSLGHNCAGTAISTAPFVGASIPITTKKVVFDIVKAELVCN